MTMFRAQLAGLGGMLPPTLTTPVHDDAAAFAVEHGGAILKPLFGSQGNGIRRIARGEELGGAESVGGIYHLQSFIGPATPGRHADIRVLVSGDEAVAAMSRSGPDWVTNVHQGGTPEVLDLSPELARLAVAAARAVGADYAGVDLIARPGGGFAILEVNSNPAWKGLQSVNPSVAIAERLAADFLAARSEAFITMAFKMACTLELSALKPGNVHVFADGHGMTVADFTASAKASAPFIARAGQNVGGRIAAAAAAAYACAGQNTNVGICLLCAPIAAAAESLAPGTNDAGILQAATGRVLEGLTVHDAADAYTAIRLMNPAGLGSAKDQDISTHPTLDLRSAMSLAADRDQIAKAYTDNFADLFEVGLPCYRQALNEGRPAEEAVSALHMTYLARFPDSHICRKIGADTAEAVRRQACATDPSDQAAMLGFDADLKRRGINPGTTADLVVATLFIAEILWPSRRPIPDVSACLKF
jgi:triphosphoribosyl-dephospho-CoA synthase